MTLKLVDPTFMILKEKARMLLLLLKDQTLTVQVEMKVMLIILLKMYDHTYLGIRWYKLTSHFRVAIIPTIFSFWWILDFYLLLFCSVFLYSTFVDFYLSGWIVLSNSQFFCTLDFGCIGFEYNCTIFNINFIRHYKNILTPQ